MRRSEFFVANCKENLVRFIGSWFSEARIYRIRGAEGETFLKQRAFSSGEI
jgi:hypothetical protein